MSFSYFFVVNPCSSSGKTRLKWMRTFLPEIEKKIANFGWGFTKAIGDAAALAAWAKKAGYHVIVAVGGDGTINEVVNGIVSAQNCEKEIELENSSSIQGYLPPKTSEPPVTFKLGILPQGTGCDFIRSLLIPKNFNDALDIITQNNSKSVNIGRIHYTKDKNQPMAHSRYFINIAGCGANGDTVHIVNSLKKRFGSTLSFYYGAIKTILKNRERQVSISYDDGPMVPLNLQVLFVCNGNFCGGGMKIAKEALLDDGFFHTVEIKKINRLKTILLTNRLYNGNLGALN